MSHNSVRARPDVGLWQAQGLRLTVFPASTAEVTADNNWWKDVLGDEPAVQSIQKGRLVREEQGEALGGLLALTIRPGRIDWGLASTLRQDEVPQAFPTVGSALEILPRYHDLLSRWLPTSPPLDRLAVGLQALLPVEDHATAYHVLDALLPFVEVDPASRDFRFQINRPRPSRTGIENLTINRLVTWHALRMQVVATLPGGKRVGAPPLYAVIAEMDINTAAEFEGPLPQGRLSDLFDECRDLLVALLEQGDHP